MASIKDISGLPQEYKRVKKQNEQKKAHSTNSDNLKPKASVFPGKDTAQISNQAQALSESKSELDKYVAEIQKFQTLSSDRIQNISEKINSDFYSRSAVLEKIIESFLFSSDINSISKDGQTKGKALTDEQLQHLREKIQNGNYDSNNVLNTIANKLLKIL